EYVCGPFVPCVLVPSPQLITVLTMSFSGSVQLPLAVTLRGTGPLAGATVSAQVGGTFGLLTVTVWDADPVSPAESVAVNVTVNEPGLMKVWVPLVPTVLVPSPQVITSLMMSFSGSVQLPVAVTASGAGPLLGATWSVHEGGAFGGVTTIC